MVRIYINGKRITKDELSNIEIQLELLNRILSEKMKKTHENGR